MVYGLAELEKLNAKATAEAMNKKPRIRGLVIIMRGIPGSGKSTLAATLSEQYRADAKRVVTVSADDFFMVGDILGELSYKFDPSKIGEAHARCMLDFLYALSDKVDVVIVDNTNTRVWEFDHYRQAAILAGYEVHVVECVTVTIDQVRMCAERNVHGVPPAVVAQMAMQFEVDHQRPLLRKAV